MRSGCGIWLCSGPGVVPSLPEPESPNSARMVKTLSDFPSGNSTVSPVANVTVDPPPACFFSVALPLPSMVRALARSRACSADFGPGRLSERWVELVAPDSARTAVGLLGLCRCRDGKGGGHRCDAGQRREGAWSHWSSR